MNSKNRAEWLRAPLCLEKGKTGRKSLAECDEMRSSDVTKLARTAQVTCQDVLLSSGGTLIPNDGVGSTAEKANCTYGVDSDTRYPLDSFIFDERLSWRARGVLVYASTHPGFVITPATLVSVTSPKETMGREKAADIINELITTGYVSSLGRDNLVYLKQPIPQSLRRQVFERDGHRCVRCESVMRLSADHIVPESQGGQTTLDNLQTLCMPCNNEKGTKAWGAVAV